MFHNIHASYNELLADSAMAPKSLTATASNGTGTRQLDVRVQVRLAAILSVVAVAAAVGLTELLWSSGRPAMQVEGAVPGFTYQLQPGDTLRVGAPGPSGWTSQNGTLAPLAHDPTSATFRATSSGVGMVTTTYKCGVNQFDCNTSYAVVVTPRRSYDLAVSGLSEGTYVLRVGEEVVFGYNGVSVSSSSTSVLEPEGPLSGPGPGLSVFRAARPGQASLAFRRSWVCVDAHVCPGPGQPASIKFIVSNSNRRFDHYASVRDGSTTIHLQKGETLEVSLAPEPGFEPWGWSASDTMRIDNIPDQRLLDVGSLGQGGLTDPDTKYFRNQNGWILPDRAGFLVKTLGMAQMGFIARPTDCRPAEECPKLSRLFTLTLEVDS
jgi:hypothetical protein